MNVARMQTADRSKERLASAVLVWEESMKEKATRGAVDFGGKDEHRSWELNLGGRPPTEISF